MLRAHNLVIQSYIIVNNITMKFLVVTPPSIYHIPLVLVPLSQSTFPLFFFRDGLGQRRQGGSFRHSDGEGRGSPWFALSVARIFVSQVERLVRSWRTAFQEIGPQHHMMMLMPYVCTYILTHKYQNCNVVRMTGAVRGSLSVRKTARRVAIPQMK